MAYTITIRPIGMNIAANVVVFEWYVKARNKQNRRVKKKLVE